MRALVLVILAALSACAPASLPDPQLQSIAPTQMLASESTTLNAKAQLVFPFSADYSASKLSASSSVVLTVGPVALVDVRYDALSDMITGFLPSELEPGTYDVKVKLSDDRTGTLPGGFTVGTGAWPDGYQIDAIADQRQNVPFAVTIRATGTNAASFHGTVRLDSSRGNVAPGLSGAFQSGVRVEAVTLPFQSSAVTLIVSDLAGHTGTSNTFRVQ